MDRQTITKRIGAISDKLSLLQNTLYALNMTDTQRYPDSYEELSSDAVLRAERITCSLRHLIYSGTTIKKADYLALAAAAQGIDISYEDGIFEITLPCLFSKRKQRQSTEFLTDPIFFALDRYINNNPMPRFKHCTVYFSHIYSQEMSFRRMQNYDNLERKQVLDVISTFIMVDDSGMLCDTYNNIELGETDCTKVSVMAKDCFSE